jgi:hypothetical protein
MECTGGNANVGIGREALKMNLVGNGNVGIGHQALHDAVGSNNVAIGRNAGYMCTGTGSVFIGNHAGFSETSGDRLYIANTETTTPLIYGEFPNVRLNFNAQNINFGNVTIEATAGAITNYAILEFGGTQYKIPLHALS